jgi:hypothetical protein
VQPLPETVQEVCFAPENRKDIEHFMRQYVQLGISGRVEFNEGGVLV